MNNEMPVIFAYSRREAIADGVLVDVSELARRAGFCVPVATTAAVHQQVVRVPEGVGCQDESARLWDVLNCCRVAALAHRSSSSELCFEVLVQYERQRKVRLKSVCGPGDDGRPCVTIMLPEED
ncbi:MAG: hypothetical protein K2P78_09370 [Gemmataceae bacterium]|nr:hypothetical protein [Gemmataceae bacterium]